MKPIIEKERLLKVRGLGHKKIDSFLSFFQIEENRDIIRRLIREGVIRDEDIPTFEFLINDDENLHSERN